MSAEPKGGRRIRDDHRRSLMLHFSAMVVGLMVLAIVNRSLTPHVLWVHWALLGWGVLFAVHLFRFEKGTMATMGRRRTARRPEEQTSPESPGREAARGR